MKFVYALVALGASSLAAAQNIDLKGIPPCAMQCALSALGSKAGNCGQSDIGCLCKQPEFLENIRACVDSSCTPEDQEKTIQFAQGICKPFGIDVTTNLPSGTATVTGTSTPTSPGDSETEEPTSIDTDDSPRGNTTSIGTGGPTAAPTDTSNSASAFIAPLMPIIGAAIAAFFL